jgi:twitching motility two-component system response regulator PilH
MVVDDAKTDLMFLEKIVSDAGYLVVTAVSGEQAVEKAKTEKPDLILMDINMNNMDGFAAKRMLSSNLVTKDIPVIFVTSKDQKADRVWAQMLGAKGYITKPYTKDDIISQLNAITYI